MIGNARYILSLSLLSLCGSVFAAEDRFQQRMLERMDTNNDGVISVEEFEPPMESRLARADADKDGAVTLDEMTRHRAERMAEKAAQRAERQAEMADEMTARFNQMDTDGSGSVTPEEARLAAFNHMDSNQDGSLSVDELRRPRGGKHGKDGPRKHHGNQ